MQPNLETSLSLTSSEHFVLQYCLVPDCPHQAKLSKSKQLLGTITPILGTINPSTSSRTMWKKGGNTEYNIFSCFPIITQSCCTEMKICFSLLAAGQGVGLDGIYCTREYTHMSRAPSSTLKDTSPAFSTIFPAMTECQRSTLNFYKLWEAGAWDVMENRL